jgi:hypothetical protein
MKTPVIFRTFKAGEVVALFPFEPASGRDNGWTCTCYAQMGQHSAACPHIVYKVTRPSTRSEIAPLRRELVQLGYKLKTVQRFPRNAYAVRQATLRNGKGDE